MLDAKTQATLAIVVRRESRSMLSYMADAYPWASQKQSPALDAIREASQAVSEAVTALGRFLIKQRMTPPMLGAYPTYFTSCNFMAVDWLLPKLISSEKELLAQVTTDLKGISNAEVRKHLADFAEVKKQALARLEALAGQPAAA
jgi:hypothetical protein